MRTKAKQSNNSFKQAIAKQVMALRMVQFALLLSCFVSLALASNDSSPPPLPTGGTLVVNAIYSNGSPVAAVPILVLARFGNETSIYRLLSDSSGRFILSPGSAGTYEFDAVINLPDTPGADFASTAAANTASNETITMVFYPAGSITGTVQENGLPVPNAMVRVACPSSTFDFARINGGVEAEAGEAGEFIFEALPAGACQVSSSTGSLASSQEVSVLPGKSISVKLEMRNKAVPAQAQQQDAFLQYFLLLAFIAAIVAIAAYLNGRMKKQPAPREQEEKKPSLAVQSRAARQPQIAAKAPATPQGIGLDVHSQKAKAILSTLSERESEIVRHLFASNGRSKRSTMQNKLLIPKTSLLRNLRALERKNIVKLIPFGRNMVAELKKELFE
jgi:uncharacterized membrane protein